jgi:hypothetical protein
VGVVEAALEGWLGVLIGSAWVCFELAPNSG